MIKACIFDAFGTLFNLDSRLMEEVGHPKTKDILDYARGKQLSYTWLRTLMEDYQPFDEITRAALADGCVLHDVDVSLVGTIAGLYFNPVVFDDVVPSLAALSSQGLTLGILSNGTRPMLNSGIQSNRLDQYIDRMFSADDIHVYKPAPRVYAMVTEGLDLSPAEVLFASSNQWDVAGAARFGLSVAWINRNGVARESIADHPRVTEVSALSDISTLTRRV